MYIANNINGTAILYMGLLLSNLQHIMVCIPSIIVLHTILLQKGVTTKIQLPTYIYDLFSLSRLSCIVL